MQVTLQLHGFGYGTRPLPAGPGEHARRHDSTREHTRTASELESICGCSTPHRGVSPDANNRPATADCQSAVAVVTHGTTTTRNFTSTHTILKLRLRATLEFCTFSAPLRALRQWGKERHAYAHAHNDGWHSHSRAVAEQQQPSSSSSSNSDHNLRSLDSKYEGVKLSSKLNMTSKSIHKAEHAKESRPNHNLKSTGGAAHNGGRRHQHRDKVKQSGQWQRGRLGEERGRPEQGQQQRRG